MIIKKETSYQISSIINVLREWSKFDEGCSILCQFIEVGKRIKLIPNPLPLSSFYCFFPMLDLNFDSPSRDKDQSSRSGRKNW